MRKLSHRFKALPILLHLFLMLIVLLASTMLISNSSIAEASESEIAMISAGQAHGVALYDQTEGRFYIKDDTNPGHADRTFRYGPSNNAWLPVAGEWSSTKLNWIGWFWTEFHYTSGFLTGVTEHIRISASESSGNVVINATIGGRFTQRTFYLREGEIYTLRVRVSGTSIGGYPSRYTLTLGSPSAETNFTRLTNFSRSFAVGSVSLSISPEHIPKNDYRAGVALYDQSQGRFLVKDDSSPGYADREFSYGPENNDWLPVAGDWDGNGIYGVALYDQQGGRFLVKDDTQPGWADREFRYGPKNNDWVPVAGAW